jgi:signal transduction histidine kinase
MLVFLAANNYIIFRNTIIQNFLNQKYLLTYRIEAQINSYFNNIKFLFDRNYYFAKDFLSDVSEMPFDEIEREIEKKCNKLMEYELYLINKDLKCLKGDSECEEEAYLHRYHILRVLNNEVNFDVSEFNIDFKNWYVKKDYFASYYDKVIGVDCRVSIFNLIEHLKNLASTIPDLLDMQLLLKENRVYLLDITKDGVKSYVYSLKEWEKYKKNFFTKVIKDNDKYYFFDNGKLIIFHKFKILDKDAILKVEYSAKPLLQELGNLQTRLIVIFSLLAVLIFLIYRLTAYKVSEEIIRVVKSMRENEKVKEAKKEGIISIYELEELKNRYNQFREELKTEIEKNQALLKENKRFIVDTIHQIRTPLGIITLNVDFLRDMATTKEEKEIIDEIESAIIMLSNSYEDLSYISANGILKYEAKEMLNLSDVLRRRVRFFSAMARSNDIEIVTDIDDYIHYYINKVEFERIVDNNLSNALKYSPKHSKVYVSLKRRGNFVALRFESPGKPIKHPEKIFDKNYREHSYTRGLGVGLNIVKNICEKYGIDYRVEHKDGKNIFEYVFKVGE